MRRGKRGAIWASLWPGFRSGRPGSGELPLVDIERCRPVAAPARRGRQASLLWLLLIVATVSLVGSQAPDQSDTPTPRPADPPSPSPPRCSQVPSACEQARSRTAQPDQPARPMKISQSAWQTRSPSAQRCDPDEPDSVHDPPEVAGEHNAHCGDDPGDPEDGFVPGNPVLFGRHETSTQHAVTTRNNKIPGEPFSVDARSHAPIVARQKKRRPKFGSFACDR